MKRISLITKSVGLVKKNPVIYVPSVEGESVIDGVKCDRIRQLPLSSQITFDVESTVNLFFVVLESIPDNPLVFSCPIPDMRDVSFIIREKKDSNDKFDLSFDIAKNRRLFGNVPPPMRVLIRIISLFLCIAIVLCGAVLWDQIDWAFINSNKPHTFETDELSITLTDAFLKQGSAGFDYFFVSKDCSVGVIKEDYETYPELRRYNLEEYCELIITSNDIYEWDLKNKNGLTYIEFEDRETYNVAYRIYVYETDEGFWLVRFTSTINKFKHWSPKYDRWAKSVKFK